ncbi:MAG: hypothetical protein PHU93_01240 [Candidatus Gracilibacteria bacterium]|nr:hypothetical protein [Candidatus Gracilibacteria bacterium]
MSEKKDEIINNIQRVPETQVHVGQLKESDKKKLESDITDRLKKLGKEMTHKDIRELITVIETSKSLASLKEKLVGMNHDTDDKVLQEILRIAESIRKGAIEGIKELRVDLREVLRNAPVELKKGVFISEQFKGIGKFEQSELGENIVVDIAGFGIGAIDSIMTIARLVAHLLIDLFYLPKDIIQSIQNKDSKI